MPDMTKKPYQMEYVFKASPNILFGFLTTPSGLSQWFADHVDTKGDTYIFQWSGTEERANCVDKIEPEVVRYRWEDSDDSEYFEFKIEKSEVTGDTILYITDFAADYELDDNKLLWDNQVQELYKRIGG